MGILSGQYICAVDIGSSKLSACYVRLKKKKPVSAVFASVPSKGVRDGVIVDSIEMVQAICRLMKDLKEKTGQSIKFIHTTVSGRDIVVKHSKAIIPLAERGNKVITVSDIRRVNEQAKVLGSSLEEEIIHMVPSAYTIDTKSAVKNPVGLYSHRLETDVLLVCAKLAALQGVSRAASQAGCEIRDVYFSAFASGRAVIGSEAKDGITVVCDIGCDITEILTFNELGLKSVELLALGGNTLTEALGSELKVPLDLAEEIKRSYGVVGNPEHIPLDKEILIKKTAAYKPIKQRLVAEVVTRKVKELCVKIKEAVETKNHLYEIGAFYVVGRTVMLEGFIEALENTLGIPVKIGRLSEERLPRVLCDDPALSGQNYLGYLTAAGIVGEVLNGKRDALNAPPGEQARNPFVRAVRRFADVYQEYF